jgi:hypothetical protein
MAQGVGSKFKPQYCKQNKTLQSWALVAHAYNPNYLGGRDQEDQGLKPSQPRKIVCETLSRKYLTKKENT